MRKWKIFDYDCIKINLLKVKTPITPILISVGYNYYNQRNNN